ncbi:Inosine-5'-monophosphate dehydrogenase [Methanosarcinaceae archaeon Ag5]|uniref:Inosine-5'-monophosphate dehydrogenase n=1 Tax=Methanolapillus africanus TaxID=3028297 RepID=A0AAE4MIX9_9EURY|nr:Inosine-5'-monophosphate dehydrogenase [Methanosarcinaceae archaeon Ag5]
MKMKNIMSAPVYVVGPDETVARARNLMMKHKVGSILVVDGDAVAGIFTKSDLKVRLFEEEAAWKRRPIDQIPIKSICSADVVTVSPNTSVFEAAKIMAEKGIDHLPVVDKEIMGIVSKTDIVRFVAESGTGSEVMVLDSMSGKAVTVNTNHTINHIIGEMEKNNVQKVIVMDNNEKAVGIVSIKDLSANDLLADVVSEKNGKNKKDKSRRYAIDLPFVAEDLMTHIITVDVSAPITTAAKKIIDNNVASLPVTKNGKIAGMISRDDIIKSISGLSE